MSGRPSWKSAEIGLFRPFSAFFALFWRVQRAPGKSRKRRKKAFFLRYPQICLSPHLLNLHLRHSNLRDLKGSQPMQNLAVKKKSFMLSLGGETFIESASETFSISKRGAQSLLETFRIVFRLFFRGFRAIFRIDLNLFSGAILFGRRAP